MRAALPAIVLGLCLGGGPALGTPDGKSEPSARPPSTTRVPKVPSHRDPLRRGHLNQRLGEDEPTPREEMDPEFRRIEANDRIRKLDERLKKLRARHRELSEKADYFDFDPDAKAQYGIDELEYATPEEVEAFLGAQLGWLDREIAETEKKRKEARADLDAALRDLGVDPADAEGAKPPPPKKTKTKGAEQAQRPTGPKPGETSADAADDALRILREIEADEAGGKAARDVREGAERAAEALKESGRSDAGAGEPPADTGAPEKVPRLPRDPETGKPVVDGALGETPGSRPR